MHKKAKKSSNNYVKNQKYTGYSVLEVIVSTVIILIIFLLFSRMMNNIFLSKQGNIGIRELIKPVSTRTNTLHYEQYRLKVENLKVNEYPFVNISILTEDNRILLSEIQFVQEDSVYDFR